MSDRSEHQALGGLDAGGQGDTRIGYVSRLDRDVIVILGSGSPPELSVVDDGQSTSVDSVLTSCRTLLPDGDEAAGWVMVARMPFARLVEGNGVSVAGVDSAAGLDFQVLNDSMTDLRTLVRRGLAPLDAPTRTRLVTFLAAAAQGRANAPSQELSKKLFEVREALRERYPLHVSLIGKHRGLVVDQLLRVDERSFFVQGWLRDEEADLVRLTAVSPEGCRADLQEKIFRYRRPDVATFFSDEGWPALKDGLCCYFELDAPSLLPNGWVMEMENAKGVRIEIQVPAPIEDLAAVRAALLNETMRERVPSEHLMANHILPAMSRIQGQAEIEVRIERVTTYGTNPDSPEVSVIVPVYQQIEHLEAQLAAFADDPAMHECDLIYVLDSPEQAQVFENLASFLFPIYRVPFRIAVLEQNVGFAGANNAGASIARGRVLLLLNSDVLPDRPGWLETMCDFYDSKPDMGALGPKLLYEDDTIQHAGMYLQQPPNLPMWFDGHYCKGLHRTFPEANVARPVPAVSGACMMIDRRLYEELGGLSGKYVRGDWEDVDLCLQLMDMGKKNWYVPDAELYHLEGQSYAAHVRMASNTYNTWLHTHLWKDRIAEIMEREEFQPFVS